MVRSALGVSGIWQNINDERSSKWQANVDIAAVRAMVVAAFTARTRPTSIATTRSTASGAAAQATGAAAYMLRTRYIGTAPEGTSASGAARRQMAPAASIRRRVATRSKGISEGRQPIVLLEWWRGR